MHYAQLRDKRTSSHISTLLLTTKIRDFLLF